MNTEKLNRWVKNNRGWLILGSVLLAAEIFFDLGEVVLGHLMQASNPFRPKVGRLWIEEEKDLAGQQQVTSIVDSLSNHPFRSGPIHTLEDLAAYLNYKNRIVVSRDDFLNLYAALPDSEAQLLLDPLQLEALREDLSWQSTSLMSGEGQMTVIFNDSYGQPMLVTHPIGPVLPTILPENTLPSLLEADERYKDRTIKPPLFLAAYHHLPKRYQLQVINDPVFIARNPSDWVMIAIAPYVRNGSVTLICEIKQEGMNTLHTFQASELAIHYLIQAIAQLSDQQTKLTPPKREELP